MTDVDISELTADKALTQDQFVYALGFITTFTDKRVTPMNLTADMIDIQDIAHSLARICRYAGHAVGFASVAEHSVRVSYMVPAEQALAALLHDATEAYLGDVPRPLKRLPEMQFYRDAEDVGMRAVAAKFGTVYPLTEEIHAADKQDLLYEMDNIRFRENGGLQPYAAETLFLNRFWELTR